MKNVCIRDLLAPIGAHELYHAVRRMRRQSVSTRFNEVLIPQPCRILGFTHFAPGPKLRFEVILRIRGSSFWSVRLIAVLCVLLASRLSTVRAQETQQKPADKSAEKTPAPATPEFPAQLALLETRVRFENNGDSRKEVHTIVKINNELGVRQFARLNFDYNRAFEKIEIPLVRITHASGGTADILPTAITDNPNPAVVNAPAYQDVRIKSIRILGLAPGDTLEYRVITTVSHHPLAPYFWLDHSFDRSGVVAQEIFELDLPASRNADVRINPATLATSTEKSGEGDSARTCYRWKIAATDLPKEGQNSSKDSQQAEPDVAISTEAWESLSIRLDEKLTPGAKPLETISNYEESRRELSRKYNVSPEVAAKALELSKQAETNRGKLEALYDFVSQKIATIDLPLGSTGFVARPAKDILESGYAIAEDKFALFTALAVALKFNAEAALAGYCEKDGLARPSVFKHLLVSAYDGKKSYWLDPSVEVAPFGMVSEIGQKCVFVLNRQFFSMNSPGHEWQPFDRKLPFAARQRVNVSASLTQDGKLTAKVKYTMRGDNELLLRVAFHQTPKEKWNDVAQLLSLSDGFRGKIISTTASDPYATKEPFTVEYEIEQAKFVDWSKKPVRIPAILPLVALPDPPAKPAPGAAASPIDLGTPLDVETKMTLQLPAGTSARTPTGVSVARDYATFASQYSAKDATITASRHINFLLREVAAVYAGDYNAFVRAVQNDQSQDFTLERQESTPKTNSATPGTAAPPKTTPPKR